MQKHAMCAALVAALLGWGVATAAPAFELDEALATADTDADHRGQARLRGTGLLRDALRLPALGFEEEMAVRAARATALRDGEPLQIGIARDTGRDVLGDKDLAWQRQPDGTHVARLRVTSSGAVALRSGLLFASPANLARPGQDSQDWRMYAEQLEGLTLRFAGADGQAFAMHGHELLADELNWSPVTSGESMTIEVELAAGLDPTALALRIPQLSHLDIHPAASEAAIAGKIGESDSCERDIVCRSNPSGGFQNAEKAVARMVFTKGGSSYLCTGTLLNNSNSPRRQMFWSANHCISSQTVANTLQTYWFYKATTCNGSTVNPGARTLSGGAYLRYNNSQRDTLLLELKTTPPAGAVYASWTSAAIGATNTAIEGIHHPAGDVKMYSLGRVTQLSGAIDGKGPFYRVQWSTGVTEGGSSGSALYTINSSGTYQLRGGLYGGTSYCSAPTAPDYYSRLTDVWTSVQPYLSP
jgi:hypothetical protein